MERNFNKRDFEDFIQQSADQYRMFPSEKVWNKIHGTLHTRRKWYGAGLALLLLSTVSAVTWVMLSYPNGKKTNDISPLRVQPSQQTISSVSSEEIQQVISFHTTTPAEKTNTSDVITSAEWDGNFFAVNTNNVAPTPTYLDRESDVRKTITLQEQAIPTSPVVSAHALYADSDLVVPSINDVLSFEEPAIENTISTNKVAQYPLTIESVTNTYQSPRQRKKMSWQVFFSPTVSYRSLNENKYAPFLGVVTPGSYPFSTSGTQNVNNAVQHKPDLGLEFGLTTRYPVSKTVNLRTGLQFNIRRYDIKAFASRGEMASIDLAGTAGTATVWTYYRTKNGYKADWLKNFYLTVSVPVGAEVKLFGNKKTNVGIAGSVQPTYVISDRAYLISSDYKNYAEIPSLVRHMNVNTSFETFVNYKTGKTQWQVGPQVRYQLLSSFQKIYPVKEHLFDFGMRVGITLNNH